MGHTRRTPLVLLGILLAILRGIWVRPARSRACLSRIGARLARLSQRPIWFRPWLWLRLRLLVSRHRLLRARLRTRRRYRLLHRLGLWTLLRARLRFGPSRGRLFDTRLRLRLRLLGSRHGFLRTRFRAWRDRLFHRLALSRLLHARL